MTLMTAPPISERLKKLLTSFGYDLYSAAKKTDGELLRLPGFGRAALRETRAASPRIQYIQALTPEHVRGCVLVVDLAEATDVKHLASLISTVRGLSFVSKGSEIYATRYFGDAP